MKKNIFCFLCLLLFSSVNAEDFYIKTGGGIFSQSSNSSVGYSGSAAVGINVFSNFYFFLNGEFNQFQLGPYREPYNAPNYLLNIQDWTFMGNLQYEYPLSEFFKPYIFGGLGKVGSSYQYSPVTPPNATFSQNFTGYQLGVGSDEKLSKGFYVYDEVKWLYFGGINFFQLQGGVKFGL